jgi:hypothetical protein
MRVRSDIWVSAYLRRCQAAGAAVFVARRGDRDAGAIYICVNGLDGFVGVYAPAPAGLSTASVDRRWTRRFKDPVSEQEASLYLAREANADPDIWIIEVEDRSGRHFLGEDDIEELR